MLRLIHAIVIAALFSNGFVAFAQSGSSNEVKFKRQIVEHGINQIVRLKLVSNETLEGRISEIRNDSFRLQLVDAAGQINTRDIAYSDLSKVSKVNGRKAGSPFKRGFLMGAGIYLGMVAVAAIVVGVASAASR